MPLRVVRSVGLDSAPEPWSVLAHASRRIFSTPEWATAWWAEYGRGREAEVLSAVDAKGVVIGVLPFYVATQRGLKVGRLIGHGAGDELGPVCSPEASAEVGRALSDWLRGDMGSDVFLTESLPAVEGWEQYLGGTVLRRSANPVTHFPDGDWDAFLATMSANARSQLRSRERKLFREHAAVYRVTSGRDELEADLDTFFALHRMRWGGASSLLRREPFYRRFAATAFDRGWLQLSILSAAGAPIASGMDFRYAGIQFQYNSGRDPAWDDASAGTVLRAITMRDAIAAGIREYRFLRGDESYKQRFATDDRGLVTLASGVSTLGKVVVALAAASAGFGPTRRLLARAGRGTG
jgi:CelD/BcsL family acetyltransferase involved in cellulose biosynthesis